MHRDLNDIIPPSKRKSFGDMAPTPSREPQAQEERGESPIRHMPETSFERSPERPQYTDTAFSTPTPLPRQPIRLPSKFPIGTALVALAVIVGCGLVFYSFSGAKVVVAPVTSPATVTTDLVAYLDKGDLTYQTITVEKTATSDIKASGVANVSEASHGSIVIHNSQSTKQPLIKNTRFQTTDGLIFRIHDSVVVPAGGDLTVDVYADEPGDKYNIGPASFTIPGLKGNPAFALVTAKSSASMTGGFVGQRASAPQDVKDKAYATMQAELTTQLQKDIAAKVPAGYVLIPGASYPSYTPGPDSTKSSDTVTLAEKGSIVAVVFPEEALARAVAFKSIGTYDGSAVSFAGVDGLTIKPSEATLAPDATEYTFNISGNTSIVWKIDSEKIAGAVAGKSRQSAEVALKSFLELDSATIVLRPFWANSFPADPKKIQVVIQKAKTGN